MDFYDALKNRRSIYAIDKKKIVSEERIVEIVEEALLHTPSAYNSQSGRAVVLFGENHDRLWQIVSEVLKDVVPAKNFPTTQKKLDGFAAGYGTILFFEDSAVVQSLVEKFPLYKDAFPVYSLQSSGMLQFVIWTAIEAEGLGASLQHYNPLIDSKVKEEWNIPDSWSLISQMPFGNPTAPAGEKEFLPINERLKVFK